jgi:hypothetical protein
MFQLLIPISSVVKGNDQRDRMSSAKRLRVLIIISSQTKRNALVFPRIAIFCAPHYVPLRYSMGIERRIHLSDRKITITFRTDRIANKSNPRRQGRLG